MPYANQKRRKPKGMSLSMANRRAFSNVQLVISIVIVAILTVFVFMSVRSFFSQNGHHVATDSLTEAFSDSNLLDSATLRVVDSNALKELDNAAKDGWTTEVFSERAMAQLQQIANALAEGVLLEEKLRSLVTPTFTCERLRPTTHIVYRDTTIEVCRATDKDTSHNGHTAFENATGLVTALNELTDLKTQLSKTRVKFKLFRVDPQDDHTTTRQLLSMAGRDENGLFEIHANWQIRWRDPTGGLPRIDWIGLRDFEEVRLVDKGQSHLFADCTPSVLGGQPSYEQQLLFGFNHWLQRSQDYRFNFLLGNPGLAVGDVNNDGLDDLYLCQEAGLPNRLYLHQPDGTATEHSKLAGVDWLENSKCALLVDLDNDHDNDLVVGINGGVVLAANDGTGRFTIRSVLDSNDDVMSLSAADFDLDGKLDLYVGVYHRGSSRDGSTESAVAAASAGIVYHDANRGGGNSLFHNRTNSSGDWSFHDITLEIGLDQNNRRFTLAAAWEDYDNDGDQDLYVANDFGRNNLYRNVVDQNGQRRFVDVAREFNAEDSASGMSVDWSDYDRDGRVDLYVSNMFSAAGNRITFHDKFKPQASTEVKQRLQRFARGNTLLRNAKHGFQDRSNPAGVTMGRWAWGSRFVDVNNDGWDDLVVANGYITTDDDGDL